jgi:predicted RNA-binding Zn-ribbon protein involved in translation (DUF1610 family)
MPEFLCKKSSPADLGKGRNYCDMSANDSTARRTAEKVMAAKKRAPGWQLRCLNCGFTEPWGKRGVRRKAIGRKYTYGRCPHCKRVRIRVIEKVPAKSPFESG